MIAKNNTNWAYLTGYVANNVINTASGTVTPMFNPSILTFGKSTECIDITIDLKHSNYKNNNKTSEFCKLEN